MAKSGIEKYGKNTNKSKTTLRPSKYSYLRGNKKALTNSSKISRTEVQNFLNDTTNIPNTRKLVSDAAWKNILSEFKSNPDLQELDMANVKLPYGSGDRIIGRRIGTPNRLKSMGVSSNINSSGSVDIKGVDNNIKKPKKSRKVNAYNYKKGRPYSKLKQALRTR